MGPSASFHLTRNTVAISERCLTGRSQQSDIPVDAISVINCTLYIVLYFLNEALFTLDSARSSFLNLRSVHPAKSRPFKLYLIKYTEAHIFSSIIQGNLGDTLDISRFKASQMDSITEESRVA